MMNHVDISCRSPTADSAAFHSLGNCDPRLFLPSVRTLFGNKSLHIALDSNKLVVFIVW